MKNRCKKFIFLWAMMFFSIAVSAADWPATLYMEQSSFSSTGRVSATGNNGVYEFTLTYPTSTTTTPRYYIFSSATTAANARKGTYKIYGASTIADATTLQPADGHKYPLVDLSSSEDADALISGATICAFLPVYCTGATFDITVDLNDMSVVFKRNPAEDQVTTLGIFNKAKTDALAIADVVDGKASYSIKVTDETNIYFASNAEKRTNTTDKSIWGSTSQVNPDNVTVTTGQTYPLERTTYRKVYTDVTCSFTLPAGAYDIHVDLNTGKVEFAEFTGKYRAKPETLYMRTNVFGSSALATAQGENGVYTFTFDKSSSYTSAPVYAVFTEATNYTKAQSATWVLGSTPEDTNVVPEYGKTYTLVDVDPVNVYTNQVGTFMPLYPQKYEIVVDLNTMTVKFNPMIESNPLTTLYMLTDATYSYKQAAVADISSDGVFRFSFHGATGTKVFFTTASSRSAMMDPAVINFGAGGHANPIIKAVGYNSSHTMAPSTYYRLYTKTTDYIELPGKCDIEFNPTTYLLTVKPYTGEYENYPETLYMRSSSFSSTPYCAATGSNGVYTFEYQTQSVTSSPRKIIFTDATSYSSVAPITWVLGSSDDGSIVEPYPGVESTLYNVNASDVYSNGESYFVPFWPYNYTITVDLKKRTVKWGDPEPVPGSLKLLDDNFRVLSEVSGNADGVFTFETISYSRHPLFITKASSLSGMRETPYILYPSQYSAPKDIDIADQLSGPVYHGTYYERNYGYASYWMTPEGCNKLRATLDYKNDKIEWSVTPFVPAQPEVLYMVDRNLKPLAQVVSDNSGIFDFEVQLDSYSYIAFSDSPGDSYGSERVFYGSAAPYDASRAYPETGVEYDIFLTSPDVVKDYSATFYLDEGRWKIHVDMNTKKVTFTDISLGGTWYTPETLALCDDNLNVIATGTKTEDGVFTFDGVVISEDKGATKVVFLDTAEGGSIFGANANGELGPTVVSDGVYDLYMPKKMWITTDGASCFTLTPTTYNITVDFNNKTVKFFDPTLPVYPDKIQLITPDEEAEVISSTKGNNGIYRFPMRNDQPVTIVFSNPENGKRYGSVETNPSVENATVLNIVESATPTAITVPEGIWTVEFNLIDMTAKFTETIRPVFISTTMPSGTTFPSYFGTGFDSKAVFTFNNNLSKISGVWVVIGDYAGGTPVEGETTVLGLRKASLVDNTLVIDFTGQKYVLPEGAEPKVHIVLSTIVDSNGETLVCDPIEGLPAGSMVFEYPFSEFARIAVDSQFEPASGSNIDEITTINLRVNHFDDITFNNIMLTYVDPNYQPEEGSDNNDSDNNTEDGDTGEEKEVPVVKVPVHWERGDTGEDGYTELTIDVPMAIRGIGELELIFDGLDIDDGYDDHNRDITATYITLVDPTVMVTVTPEAGSTVSRIDEITMTWTHPIISSVGNLASKAIITNKATEEKTEATYSYLGGDNSLVITPELPIEADGVYTLEIGAGDIVFNDTRDSVNNPIAIDLTVDSMLGIDTVNIDDNEDVEVVTLSGIVLRRGKGKSTLRGLQGVYIVNGVKCRL